MSLVLGKNPSNELKEIELTNSGLLKVDIAGSSGTVSANVDVTGNTIGLATESTLSGVATESTLASVQTDVATVAGAVSGSEMQVDVVSSALPSGASTSSNQSTMISSLGTIAGAVSGSEMQVDVVSSALPSGAATSALQTTGNTSLAAIETDTGSIDTATTSIDGKLSQGYDAQIASGGSGLQQNLMYGRDNSGNLDALKTDSSGHLEITVDDFVKGQATMANSFPVVIASNQSAISVASAGGNTSNNNEAIAPGAGNTANSTGVDMDGYTNLTIFGSSTNTSDPIVVQVSHNNSTWVEHTEYFINMSASGGEYAVNISNTGARYWRVSQTDTLASAFTLVVNSSKK